MVEKGLEPEFSRDVLAELDRIRGAAPPAGAGIRDLRDRLWGSIDNDDSRDLDQLTVAEPLADGATRIFVAVADVDALVAKDSAIDAHARTEHDLRLHGGRDLPDAAGEALDGPDVAERGRGPPRGRRRDDRREERRPSGRSEVYRAAVRNQAKLAYDAVARGSRAATFPEKARAVPGVDRAAPAAGRASRRPLRGRREEEGALDLETIEPRAVFDDDAIVDLAVQEKNRARELIEDFMIAANGTTARFLASTGIAVPAPRRALARAVATDRGDRAGARRAPAGRARQPRRSRSSCWQRRRADPLRFPDLSLVDREADGRGRVRRRAAGPDARSATSAWRCGTTPTRPRRTGAFPTSSPSGC